MKKVFLIDLEMGMIATGVLSGLVVLFMVTVMGRFYEKEKRK